MATAISKTPTLKGKEAENFQKLANANKNKCASKKEVECAIKTFISVLRKQEIISK
ncbi:hypothetical protein [Candidatus Infernicultor aquiphilus]|uniref:hypothetical protein n=1 Tax=Candidatus Infernicultor aquiphilus TaxID=1805029 RepID=UPI002679AA9B